MTDKSWPSRFGTLGEKVFGEDDPFNESCPVRHIINDEMPATKSPITGKFYTSKTRLREEYKGYGAEEVGTAYDNGYDPQKETQKDRERRFDERLHETFKRNLNK